MLKTIPNPYSTFKKPAINLQREKIRRKSGALGQNKLTLNVSSIANFFPISGIVTVSVNRKPTNLLATSVPTKQKPDS